MHPTANSVALMRETWPSRCLALISFSSVGVKVDARKDGQKHTGSTCAFIVPDACARCRLHFLSVDIVNPNQSLEQNCVEPARRSEERRVGKECRSGVWWDE